MANSDERVIKNAQYRKGLSIAFFNATNNAIEMMRLHVANLNVKPTPEEIVAHVKSFRDALLEEHKNYYATVIEKISGNYKAAETIERLKKKSTDVDSLRLEWVLLSEDERRDKDIIKAVQKLKAKYETIQRN